MMVLVMQRLIQQFQSTRVLIHSGKRARASGPLEKITSLFANAFALLPPPYFSPPHLFCLSMFSSASRYPSHLLIVRLFFLSHLLLMSFFLPLRLIFSSASIPPTYVFSSRSYSPPQWFSSSISSHPQVLFLRKTFLLHLLSSSALSFSLPNISILRLFLNLSSPPHIPSPQHIFLLR